MASLRVCAEGGCPELQPEARCPEHRRQRERRRGTSTQRGYDYMHQQQRAAWVPLVAQGDVPCRRCGRLIDPDEPWDLGHPDADCPKPTAPEERACNRATAGRNA